MTAARAIFGKEIRGSFGSPMAFIFLGAFLVVSLFSFFWVETFFARNLADIRPLFKWMPALLIFLVSALTMRQWSEEQKMGTIETLLTLPVPVGQLVIGKFMAVLALVATALLLTAGLPLTVSMIGPIDWGPVFGGYAGALLLASAYAAIGLFISSRTDNQINALIATVLSLGLLYLVGSPAVADFVGVKVGEGLRLLGSGSRFLSIERGVIDLRDLLYYGSLTAFFLLLNVVSIESKRWSGISAQGGPRRNAVVLTVLAGLNLLALNIWMQPVSGLRLDLTQERQFSLSPATKDILAGLDEPLLLRGYFSAKTHPLLAPLIPSIRDLMTEYRLAGQGRIRVEFVDPRDSEEVESEANQSYGIKPVPFQISGRYEAAVVNSYFDILVKYGDQYTVLNFRDLIEIQTRGETGIEVRLRNLEYDLTRSIKKVSQGFQGVEGVLAALAKPAVLKGFISKDLPEELAGLPEKIRKAAEGFSKDSGGKFRYEPIDPDAPGSPVGRDELLKTYGFRPIPLSLLSEKGFFLYAALHVGESVQRIMLAPDMTEAEIRTEIESALKRGAAGFLKTVGLWTPGAGASPYGLPSQGSNYRMVREQLGQGYNVKDVDLGSGRVPGDIDVLVLVAPQDLSDAGRYGVDQFLMRGGSVIAAAGRFVLDMAALESGGLGVRPAEGGLDTLLEHYGVKVEKALVLDRQNEPFPVPVVRNLGAFQVREIRQMSYPFFVDVRSDGMAKGHPMVSTLPAVTLHWASPITVDRGKNAKRDVVTLLQSGPESWQEETSTNVQPNFERYPDLGFAVSGETGRRVLAVAVRGSFDSFFAGKPAPKPDGKAGRPDLPPTPGGEDEQGRGGALSTIDRSPESSRLVVIGSAEFLNDIVMNISRSSGQDRFMNSLEFIQNAVDWSVEDEDLLTIRSRGSHTRLLAPLGRGAQASIEWMNYGAVLVALVTISVAGIRKRRREKPMELV